MLVVIEIPTSPFAGSSRLTFSTPVDIGLPGRIRIDDDVGLLRQEFAKNLRLDGLSAALTALVSEAYHKAIPPIPVDAIVGHFNFPAIANLRA